VACGLALLGESEQVLRCLEKALKFGFGHKSWLEHHSNLDSLRSNPRSRLSLPISTVTEERSGAHARPPWQKKSPRDSLSYVLQISDGVPAFLEPQIDWPPWTGVGPSEGDHAIVGDLRTLATNGKKIAVRSQPFLWCPLSAFFRLCPHPTTR
jgi:hypothetical protein